MWGERGGTKGDGGMGAAGCLEQPLPHLITPQESLFYDEYCINNVMFIKYVFPNIFITTSKTVGTVEFH